MSMSSRGRAGAFALGGLITLPLSWVASLALACAALYQWHTHRSEEVTLTRISFPPRSTRQTSGT